MTQTRARGVHALPTPPDSYRPGVTYGRRPRHRDATSTTALTTQELAQLSPTMELPAVVPFDALLAPQVRAHAMRNDDELAAHHVFSSAAVLESWLARH